MNSKNFNAKKEGSLILEESNLERPGHDHSYRGNKKKLITKVQGDRHIDQTQSSGHK